MKSPPRWWASLLSRPTLHQRRPPLGTKCSLHALCRRGDAEQPGVQGFLSTPDCQGEEAKGRAHRLHAQADRHPEHHDRPWREVGSQTIPGGLTSAPISRSDRGRAHAKLKDRRADGVKAVSRRRRWRVSASLEAGRSPVYFNNPVALNERVRKFKANLGRFQPRDREAMFAVVRKPLASSL